MVQRTWDGSTGAYGSAADWSPAGVPVAGDTATINSGTVTVGSADLATNLTLSLDQSGATAPTLVLQGTVIPSSDDLRLGMPDTIGTPASPTSTGAVRSTGAVANDGTFDLSRATLSISGTFTNAGTMILEPYAVINLAGASDQFVNNGSLSTSRAAVFPIASGHPATPLAITVPIAGTGTISVGSGFNLELASSVGAGQTVTIFSSSGPTSQFYNTLTIDDATTFKARIAGYGANEPIVATGPAYDTVQTTRTNGTTVLSFLQGGQTVDSLSFVGRYSAAQFAISATPTLDGREQTTITFNASASAPAGPLSVYRYFSQVNGTQFLTASASEAASIGATRPDLVSEGVGFEAVNPADNDPTAVPVYRFFDTIDGTHFFTASAGERNTLIATRPDLVYEPNSTFYEHAAAQPGDVPVYRYFETTNGTHFYTAAASEVASIAATRPDLVAEGIAFYAPTG